MLGSGVTALVTGEPASWEVDEEEELDNTGRAKVTQPRPDSLPFDFGQGGIHEDGAKALPPSEEREPDGDDEYWR